MCNHQLKRISPPPNTRRRYVIVQFLLDAVFAAETDTVHFINYPIASIFNQLDVYLGDTLITSSNNTYAFRSIIETVLNYGSEAKKKLNSRWDYFQKIQRNIEETDPTKENLGLKSRNAYTNRSKTTELIGRLHTCLLYTSPSPRDKRQSRMPSSA